MFMLRKDKMTLTHKPGKLSPMLPWQHALQNIFNATFCWFLTAHNTCLTYLLLSQYSLLDAAAVFSDRICLGEAVFYTCSSELFQTLADGPECQNANCWLIKRSLTCQLSSLISVWWSDKSVWKQCWSVNSQWKRGYGVFLVVRAWRGQTISCCVLHVSEDTFGQRPEQTNNLSS